MNIAGVIFTLFFWACVSIGWIILLHRSPSRPKRQGQTRLQKFAGVPANYGHPTDDEISGKVPAKVESSTAYKQRGLVRHTLFGAPLRKKGILIGYQEFSRTALLVEIGLCLLFASTPFGWIFLYGKWGEYKRWGAQARRIQYDWRQKQTIEALQSEVELQTSLQS